ncbi:hypothetical protein VCRA2116O29_340049 [Vibrio crassostreae]|nr:hypothetical protein VCRA2116O29_340049 [Vibrio crassostreae]CAK3883978.1 hypothetical protein VCRA2123O74_630013 [Vibrio crassostreae]
MLRRDLEPAISNKFLYLKFRSHLQIAGQIHLSTTDATHAISCLRHALSHESNLSQNKQLAVFILVNDYIVTLISTSPIYWSF